jgi:hypothetical protein
MFIFLQNFTIQMFCKFFLFFFFQTNKTQTALFFSDFFRLVAFKKMLLYGTQPIQ